MFQLVCLEPRNKASNFQDFEDYIVQYAAQQRGAFRKKDLAAWLESIGTPVGAGLQTQLERLVASGKLVKSGWGAYQLNGTVSEEALSIS